MYNKGIIDGFHTIFSTASVADACDQILGRTIFLPFEIKNHINDKEIVGPAVTTYEDVTDKKLPPQHALDTTDESVSGPVIAITGNPSLETVAVWGGLMTAGATVNKHEAVVLNGDVCDLAEICRDYDSPVYVKTVTPGATLDHFKTISASQPVTIGDVTVNPRDSIVGGIDGMVCVPQMVTVEVLALTRSIDSREPKQAKPIIQSGFLCEDSARYGRIQPSYAVISRFGRWWAQTITWRT